MGQALSNVQIKNHKVLQDEVEEQFGDIKEKNVLTSSNDFSRCNSPHADETRLCKMTALEKEQRFRNFSKRGREVSELEAADTGDFGWHIRVDCSLKNMGIVTFFVTL